MDRTRANVEALRNQQHLETTTREKSVGEIPAADGRGGNHPGKSEQDFKSTLHYSHQKARAKKPHARELKFEQENHARELELEHGKHALQKEQERLRQAEKEAAHIYNYKP